MDYCYVVIENRSIRTHFVVFGAVNSFLKNCVNDFNKTFIGYVNNDFDKKHLV